MFNSKLIELLKTFSSDELKRFDDFVSSPFYNKLTPVTALFRTISKYAPKFDNKGLSKSIVYKKLYTQKTYNDKVMRNLMSELVKLTEKFLELNYYETQAGDKYNNLLNELLQRKLYKSFEKNFNEASQFLNTSYALEHNYYDILQLNSLKHSYDLIKTPKLEKRHDMNIFFDPLFALFCMFFFKVNYNLATQQDDYNYILDFTAETKFIVSLLDYINQKSLKSQPVIMIYYNLFMLFDETKNDSCFKELRTLLNRNKEIFTKVERRNFHFAMTAYCNRKTAHGDRTYNYTALEIYKEMLEDKTYAQGKSEMMLPVIFKNIVKIGISTREFDWTQNFIEKYINNLSVGFDSNFYNFSLSLLQFKKKNFDNSLQLLSGVNYENVYDKLDVKGLLIQLYYELNSYENILSQLDAYRHFLQNDILLSKKIKSIHLNFIHFVNKLITFRLKKYEKYDIESFKKELEVTITYDKGWIIEKLDEIEKKNFNSA